MDIENFRAYCLSLKGATEGMKWEHLCFMIEEKIFMLVSLEDHHMALKCDPENFDELVARPGIKQAPHFARRQWVSLEGFDVLPDRELKERVAESRKLVLSKLSKKLQQKYAD
ncbi:MAG TPA: MmcQ/YjbR family DNA-binding protein [Pedobacter sp.]|nr:MmcQ/YjbR family DNA-binding protein [Pedobacter sp.]